jgi:hypothetical protein
MLCNSINSSRRCSFPARLHSHLRFPIFINPSNKQTIPSPSSESERETTKPLHFSIHFRFKAFFSVVLEKINFSEMHIEIYAILGV